MGFTVWKPYESKEIERKTRKFGNFIVSPLPMLDKEMKVWQHTNRDKTECPCYGFYITHPKMGSTVYITDTKCVVWNFSKQRLNHIIISANYDKRYISADEVKRNHVLTGHLSIQEVCRWIGGSKSNFLRDVILCHLSSQNIDPIEAQAEVEKVAGCPTYIAQKGLKIELSEFPF